jgi:UDP-N-acetylmuramoyl-tripeptide--D-alanyl-D-alanine ligase
MFLSLLHFWTGPLPKEELLPDRPLNPFLHWFVHPVKRHLAKYYLYILQHVFGLKVVAITGSTGKTTTSNMLYSALSLSNPTIKTADSTTSTYNIPTTILKCSPSTKYLILEMGVEYPGDMDFYCWLAKPDIGVLLNVTAVHASFLGSVENIRSEKSKLLKYSKISLTASDFPKIISSQITPDLKTEIILKIKNSLAKRKIEEFDLKVVLSLIGTHYAQNVAAVTAVISRLGLPVSTINEGLESITPSLHRFNLIKLNNGNLLIDDSYNSNPISAPASLNALTEIAAVTNKTPVLIFSQMNELGQYEKAEHEKIGLLIKKLGIRNLFCIGPATEYLIESAGFGKCYATQDDLLTAFKKLYTLHSKFCILVKGSRSWHLENLVSQFDRKL